jgi:hypothetical protein
MKKLIYSVGVSPLVEIHETDDQFVVEFWSSIRDGFLKKAVAVENKQSAYDLADRWVGNLKNF